MAKLSINGQTVEVSDDFLKLTPEQQSATVDEIAKSMGDSAPQPSQAAPAPSPTLQQPGMTTDNYLTQGLSGFNEGLGNILGFPVDATTMAMNAGISGINALGGSLPQIEKPIGGSDFLKSTILAPTIAPESQGAGQQAVRRIGQELGSMAIPGMGPLARSAMPVRTLAAEVGAALGSGTGAAIAQQIAPGNPVAEFAGQMIGGLGPGAAARAVRKPPAPPSIDTLRAAKDTAYKAADNTGVTYAPAAYDDLLANVAGKAQADRISPARHQKAYSFIQEMVGSRGKPLTLTELDQLRQTVYRDLIKPSWRNPDMEADAHFGQIIVDEIDDLIMRAKPGDLVAGNAKDAANAILTARSANTRYKKSELIEEALTKAQRRTDSTGSGGNINNAIRQNIRQILDNPKKRRSFNKDEIAAMEDLVRQGKTENFLRLVGKLSPSGNGLMAGLGLVGTMVNPAIGAAQIAGMGAKAIADRGTINKAIQLQNQVARGAPAKNPRLSPEEQQRIAALMTGQVANQPEPPLMITVRGGGR